MSSYSLGTNVQLVGGASASVRTAVKVASTDMTRPTLADRVNLHNTDEIRNEREAASFLQKATFGPTYAEIQALATLGSKKAWVQDQLGRTLQRRFMDRAYLDLGVTNLVAFTNNIELDTAVTTGLIQEPAALRAKCIWSLSKLFVISHPGGAFDDPGTIYPFVSWYDRLDKFVFGNWRDLIESITYSPHMSRMLTFYANKKATGTSQPDENYARELMQLFSIGLFEMNLDGTPKLDENGEKIPTYTNDDIRQLARCLTGLTRWDFNLINEFYDRDTAQSTNKAISMFNTAVGPGVFGDPDMRLRHYLPFYEYGAKVALGGRVNIPEGTDPERNLAMLHDALFYHPNTAPFFATRMIQHLVTSNPSPAYVKRVASAFEDNGNGVRGDLKAVWMAILTDPEAANDGRIDATFGRVRDGFDLFANLMRSFDRKNNAGRVTINYYDSAYGSYTADLGPTAPRSAPSIFGAYDPLHSPPELNDRGMLAPELMMWSDLLIVRGLNKLLYIITQNEPRIANDAHKQITDYSMLPLSDTAANFIERVNLLLCGGKMNPGLRASLQSLIGSAPVATLANQQDRATAALQLVVNSPDFWVQL